MIKHGAHTPLTTKTWTRTGLSVLAAVFACQCVSIGVADRAYSESLFRAGISYQTSQAYTPGSLFNLPRARTIGDVVTVRISEVNQVVNQINSTITKEQSLEENSTSILNQMASRIFGIGDLLPVVDGHDVSDEITLRSQNQKIFNFRENISCQVVQVLPNGFLVVQGRKTLLQAKERQDLVVSGIVNPFYLTSSNEVNSQQVANLSIQVTGRGPLERRQGDGIIGKYFRLFN